MKHEIIKTDNYLLVVSDEEIKEGDYIKPNKYNTCITASKVHTTEFVSNGALNDCKKIIAHLPLNGASYLEGVDVLPEIEDETIGKPLVDYVNEKHTQEECVGFIDGYEKSKEKYKWTDADVIRIVEKSRETGLTAEYLMLTSQQPKLPIAFECEMVCGNVGCMKMVLNGVNSVCCGDNMKPKTITNLEGRTEWVGKYIWF